MKNLKLLQTGLLFMILFQSCKGQGVDDLISKYDDADFSDLRNVSAYRRSAGHEDHTTIYFLNVYRGKCSPYIVEADNKSKEVVKIGNELVIKSCEKDYWDTGQIKQLFAAYIKYDLCLVQVDDEGNVYINRSAADKPTILRKSPGSTPKDINSFRQYKGNWYVRK